MWLTGFFFVATTAVAAVRFLGLARRTRRRPEFYLGLLALCLGTSATLSVLADDAGIRVVSTSAAVAASGLNALFVSSIFADRRTRRTVLAILAALALSLAATYLLGGPRGSFVSNARLTTCSLGFLWGAWAFATHGLRARKRHAIGLATRLEWIAFACFGLAQLAIFVSFGIRVYGDLTGLAAATIHLLQIPFPMIATVSAWIALAPPAWLRRRLDRAPEVSVA
ncbi:MAG: hypothetical protein AAGC67_09240 [Myxococcota bacterium]